MKPAPPVNTAGFAILLISLLTTLECGSAARALPRSVEFQSHNRTQIDGSVSSTAEFPDLHSGASFARRRTVKPPTYNVPLDDLIRKGNEWIYRDSPLNVIPISRAPPPTFGQVTPRPRVWHRREAFYAIKTNLNFVFHGPSNYILQVSPINQPINHLGSNPDRIDFKTYRFD
ncbi:unnamed protein product [Mesocestoides corti]|uniref:Conserved secreted protein n=1 Tax=Mesocestoides corti TaxID=53468 RepID=A0A0R3UNP1_MESCO|nr:unnamed protein product [Mesocestoides corti]